MLVPLTGAFLFRDSRLVGRWRNGILELARLRDLDLPMFRKTISTFRYLPPGSLRAMLSALPTRCQGSGQKTPPEPAFTDRLEFLEQKTRRKILLGTGLLTLSLTCLVSGASLGSVTLLLLGGLLFALSTAL